MPQPLPEPQPEDIHTRTAAELFNKPQDAVTPEERRQAKTINFGLHYGTYLSTLPIPREGTTK